MTINTDNVFSPQDNFAGARYITINNGIIKDISALPVGPIGRLLDFTGFTISPFFCDYHLHFSSNAIASSKDIAASLLQHGIKKVYEGGDAAMSGIGMKKVLKSLLDVKSCGLALYRQGAYGKYIGKGVDGFKDAKELIDLLCRKKVTYIKLINSGIFNPATEQITDGGFDKEEVSDIVRYAGDKGLDVICHANGDKAIQAAVRAGVSAIVHGLFVSDETLFMMREKKTSFIPTVNAFASLPMKTVDTKTKAHIARAVDGHLMAISKAAEIGTRVLPGSDSGPQFLPYGKSFLDELAFFNKAGVPNRLVLAWAVAENFKIGMPADFVILKGSEIKTIFFHGAPINK